MPVTYGELSLVSDKLVTVHDFLASEVVHQPPLHFPQSAMLVVSHPLDSAAAAAQSKGNNDDDTETDVETVS